MKHTPGPWQQGEGTTLWVVLANDRTPICHLLLGTEAAEANARLIAAAPDMLEALEVMVHSFMYKDAPEAFNIARAAIAKAEGMS